MVQLPVTCGDHLDLRTNARLSAHRQGGRGFWPVAAALAGSLHEHNLAIAGATRLSLHRISRSRAIVAGLVLLLGGLALIELGPCGDWRRGPPARLRFHRLPEAGRPAPRPPGPLPNWPDTTSFIQNEQAAPPPRSIRQARPGTGHAERDLDRPESRRFKREALLAATEAGLAKIKASADAGRLSSGTSPIPGFTFRRDQDKIAAEAEPDGIYVIRTTMTAGTAAAQQRDPADQLQPGRAHRLTGPTPAAPAARHLPRSSAGHDASDHASDEIQRGCTI
jgi:hypothetical protein